MQVSVFQLWHGGKRLDARSSGMTSSLRGFLKIDDKDGQRFASLVDMKREQEVLPRLWSPTVQMLEGRKMLVTGVQRHHGVLCYQEWQCFIGTQDGL